MINETWKDIKGYEGCYQISNLGNVKSLARIKPNNQPVPEIIKKPQDNGNGYKYVQLKLNGSYKNFYIHRLVGEYFIDNPDNKPEINHIDGIKENNIYSNLEWVTSSENQRHAYDNGLNVPDNLDAMRKAREKYYQENSIPIVKKDINNKPIKIYKGFREAYSDLNKKANGFLERVTRTGKIAYGYYWERI